MKAVYLGQVERVPLPEPCPVCGERGTCGHEEAVAEVERLVGER